MATLAELDQRGILLKWDAGLRPPQQEERLIYASQRLVQWLQEELPTLHSGWNLEESPEQQVDALAEIFAGGDTLTYGWRFKPLAPHGSGVWELKTADVRIFGWFHQKDVFIGVCADTTQRIKDHNLYAGYRDEVVRFRDDLDLDAPKYVEGDDPNAVVSAFDYPP